MSSPPSRPPPRDGTGAVGLDDAGLSDGRALGQAYFGNCLMHMIGQTMIPGQTCLAGLTDEGVLPERPPIGRLRKNRSLSGSVNKTRLGNRTGRGDGQEASTRLGA